MSFSKTINISISPLRLHSASSVQIPSSTTKFNTMLPSIKIRSLNVLSASFINLHGITNSNVFHNNLTIRLSPLKSHILRKYTNPFKKCGMYPSISKCNAKRCKCSKHLSEGFLSYSCISELLCLCCVEILKNLPVHSFNALIIPILRDCLPNCFLVFLSFDVYLILY